MPTIANIVDTIKMNIVPNTQKRNTFNNLSLKTNILKYLLVNFDINNPILMGIIKKRGNIRKVFATSAVDMFIIIIAIIV